MKHLRWLVACVFILVLAACSSPKDLQAGLEPQFGTAEKNIGIDVTSPFAGRVYVLSTSYEYEEYFDYGEDGWSYYDGDVVYLNRYDGNGNLSWSRYITSLQCSAWDYCYGYSGALGTYSDKNGYGYSLIASENYYNIYKTDSQGNVVKYINLEYDAETVSPLNKKVAVDSSGNIYYARVNQGYDALYNVISKYNTNGALQWQRTSTVGAPTGVAVSGSNVYVVGSTGYAKYTSSGNLVWTKSGAGNDITVAGSYFYVRRGSTVLKYDGNGKQLWSKAQSGISSPVYGEMTGDSAGNIYLSGKYAASSSNRNGFVRKLNLSGTVVWTKLFGTSAYDDVRGITSVNGSEIYITGETQGSLSPLVNKGGPDGYVRELNSSGNPVWTR